MPRGQGDVVPTGQPHVLPAPRGEVPRSAVVVRPPTLADHRVPASERRLFRTAKRADPTSGT